MKKGFVLIILNVLIDLGKEKVMDEKILNMSGYEFENYISRLLINMGFDVEVTQYSNDGGIDLIATYKKPIFFGKYIIQCKRWNTSVGQPEVRDLYGVVMDQRANKGILITTSDFTTQAYDFAKGKNLELINGDVLNKLVTSNNLESYTKVENTDCSYHTDRYNYLKMKINEEPNEAQNYVDLIRYFREYIKERKDSESLINEYIEIVEKMISRCYKKESKAKDKQMALLLQAEAYIYLGELAKATEILLRNNRFFILKYPTKSEMSTEKTHGFGYGYLFSWNLLIAYKHIGYTKGCNLILGKFDDKISTYLSIHDEKVHFYIENILEKKFVQPIIRIVARGGKTKHLETNVFYLHDVLEPSYFFDKYYTKDNESCIKEINDVLRLNGII